MFYHKFLPCDKLKQFVECYFVWEGDIGENETLVIESPPNGFCSIVFNYANSYILKNKKYGQLDVPLQFICGQNIYSYKLFLNGKIGQCGVVFKPTALATIYNLAMYKYVEERVDLYAVFDKIEVDNCTNSIKEAGEKEKIKILEDWLLKHIELQKPTSDYIDEAADSIITKNGMLQVSDLLRNSFMSRRTFERKFFEKVGLSPKYFARIRRISYLCNLIAGKKKVDWSSIFYDLNYYDQAHFIKDFEEFTGRTPQQYLKENTELANYVPKP